MRLMRTCRRGGWRGGWWFGSESDCGLRIADFWGRGVLETVRGRGRGRGVGGLVVDGGDGVEVEAGAGGAGGGA
jgi:hypothetical protein